MVVRNCLCTPTLGFSSLLILGVGAALAWAYSRFRVDAVGDIAVHTATDVKSRHFEVQEWVLRVCVLTLVTALSAPTSPPPQSAARAARA